MGFLILDVRASGGYGLGVDYICYNVCERGREVWEMNGQLGNEKAVSDVLVSFKLVGKVPEITRHCSVLLSNVNMLETWRWVETRKEIGG